MSKSLNEMTDDERWQLFPVIISGHRPYWKDYYEKERALLKNALGKIVIRIHHIGSTAIPYIPAKPTVDILIEIKEETDLQRMIKKIVSLDYIYSPQPKNPAPHMMFLKGYTPQGFAEEVFHVHIRYAGNWDEIYFRDYLLEHPEIAAEYGRLKLELKERFEYNRDAYTNAKTEFIKRITNLAKNKD